MVATPAQAMPFVHPSMIGAGAVLALIPVVIHLINRRRHRRVPWAAMSFLLGAYSLSKRRIQLSQWLLMSVRMLIIALILLAVARPYIPAMAMLPVDSTLSHRIVVVDNSLSMRSRNANDISRLHGALEQARSLILSFPARDAVSIVTLAEPAEAVVGHAGLDRRVIRERLASVGGSFRPVDVVGGVARVREILKNSSAVPANRTVYVLSDFLHTVWIGRDGADPAGAATPAVQAMRQLADTLADSAANLTLIKAGGEHRPNLAIAELAVESNLITTRMPIRVRAEVVNYGPARSRQVILQIRRGGEIHRRIPIRSLGPGESISVAASFFFSTPGPHVIRAKLIADMPDALDADDIRYLSLDVRDRVPVLVVDGNPGPTLLAGEAGFLATALSPSVAAPDSAGLIGKNEETPIAATVISATELAHEPLDVYDVIVLCDVARLAKDQWSRLEQAVDRGAGLIFFSGEHLRQDNYNRFGYADGGGLLPGKLTGIVGPTGADEFGVRLRSDGLRHPIVADFKERPESGLFLARFDRYLSMEVTPSKGEVILRYSNDEPALVSSALGSGRVLFFTSTASLAWNNLAAKGDYVSLMANAVTYLLPRKSESLNLEIGQTLVEPLRAHEASLSIRVTNEQGIVRDGRIGSLGDALAFEYGPIEEPGVYRAPIGRRSLAFVANVDRRESDLTCVDEATLRKIIDRPVNIVSSATAMKRAASATPTTELASTLLYLLIALLFLEMWIALRFSASDLAVESRPGSSVTARAGSAGVRLAAKGRP